MDNADTPFTQPQDDWNPWRVSALLLAGSKYDAHIFLDAGFRAPGVTSPASRPAGSGPLPGCFMVTSGKRALEIIEHQNLELVISDVQLADMSGFELARKIKARKPQISIVLVTGNETYGRSGALIPERDEVDRIFTWYGNPDLIESILQLTEDHANADRHILGKNVRCLLLVEDEPNFFSHYLVMIHRELRERSLALIPEDATPQEYSARLRQRPKLLLAETCEEAERYLARYGSNIIGIISDLQFPRNREIDPRAGMKLIQDAKDHLTGVPIILQSYQVDMQEEITKTGAFFVHKDSDGLLLKIRQLLVDHCGFGDFIFRLPGDQVVGRAGDLKTLLGEVRRVPLESFMYHAQVNHFSTWLYLHGCYELAEILRPINGEGESLRERMLQIVEPYTR